MSSPWNMTKHMLALGVVGLLSLPLSALAGPFDVVVSGQLSGPGGFDLNGATLNLIYSYDTTDTAAQNSSGPGFARANFAGARLQDQLSTDPIAPRIS